MLEALGVIGAFMIVGAYTALQLDKCAAHDKSYLWVNMIGSVFILSSLYAYWNLAAFIIEVFWIGVTGYGLWKVYRLSSKA